MPVTYMVNGWQLHQEHWRCLWKYLLTWSAHWFHSRSKKSGTPTACDSRCVLVTYFDVRCAQRLMLSSLGRCEPFPPVPLDMFFLFWDSWWLQSPAFVLACWHAAHAAKSALEEGASEEFKQRIPCFETFSDPFADWLLNLLMYQCTSFFFVSGCCCLFPRSSFQKPIAWRPNARLRTTFVQCVAASMEVFFLSQQQEERCCSLPLCLQQELCSRGEKSCQVWKLKVLPVLVSRNLSLME